MDDNASYCGSFSGETFSSSRRRHTCSLRQHSIDVIAKQLREHDFGDKGTEPDLASRLKPPLPRWQSCFHNLRFVVVMMAGFSIGIMMMLRYNITVAILNMVNQTALYMEEHPNKTVEDFLAEGYVQGGEFNWNNEIQHMIMSWYMFAYTLPQIPFTKLGLKYGARITTPLCIFVCATSNCLIPTFAYYGWQYVLALRLINGIGAAAVLPLFLSIVENWMPFGQVSLGLTCGQMIATILQASNPLISGFLSNIHWKYAFYGPALVAMMFSILWYIVVTDRPDENWIISQRELDIICGCPHKLDDDSVSHKVCLENKSNGNKQPQQQQQQQQEQPQQPQRSWVDVLKVPSFYAYVILWCFYCSSYSCFTFILPTYLRQFLKIKVSENGFICFIILSGGLLSICWPHPLLRLLMNRFKLSLTAARRVGYLICCFACALTWGLVSATHSNQLIVLFLNRAFHGSTDIIVTASLMNNFAKAGLSSMAFSMMNTVGNLTIVFSSTSIGIVLDYTGQSVAGWTMVFGGLAGVQVVQLLIFLTLIRSEPIEFKRKVSSVGPVDEPQLVSVPPQIQAIRGLESSETYSRELPKESRNLRGNNFDQLRSQKQDSNNHNNC